MLKFFTRLEKTRNFVLLAFVGDDGGQPCILLRRRHEAASTVDLRNKHGNSGQRLRRKDHSRRLVPMQKQRYASSARAGLIPRSSCCDGMIASRIARIEAAKLGLTASDAEVRPTIREQFKPQDGTALDQSEIRAEWQPIRPAASTNFEQTVRDDMSDDEAACFHHLRRNCV